MSDSSMFGTWDVNRGKMANVDEMLMRPTDPKVVNGHVVERTPEDQMLIEEFAKSFLETKEREMIASILAKKPNELTFNAVEAEIIATRHDPSFLTGVSATGHYGFPISQFYDYILTIDNALSFLRGLHIEVLNLRSLASPELIKQLKQSILHADYIPWPIAECEEFIKMSLDDRRRKVFQLGDDNMKDHNQEERSRSPYEKCCDEAIIYDSPVYRILTGLQQGLFLVKHTVAEMLRPGDMTQLDQTNKQYIHIGNWINTWEGLADGKRQVFPFLGIPKDTTTMKIYAQAFDNKDYMQQVHNSKGFGINIEMGAKWYDHYYLMPKVYGLQNYPLNWQGRVFKEQLHGPADQLQDLFSFPNALSLFDNGHRIPVGGGPIATYHCLFHADARTGLNQASDQLSIWLKTTQPFPNNNLTLNPDSTYKSTDTDPATAKFFHAITTDWEQVAAAMTRMSYHPVWACARLAKACASSGVGAVLQNMYAMLQKHFATQLNQVDHVSLTQPDARRILTSAHRSLSHLSPGQCPTGTLPRYVNFKGEPIDEDDATFVSNGVRWLKAHVDASKCSCTPLVRAPSYSVAEAYGGGSGLSSYGVVGGMGNSLGANASVFGNQTAMPMGGTMAVSKSDILKQFTAKHMFTESNASLSSGGALSAMLAAKTKMRQAIVEDDEEEDHDDDDDDDDEKDKDDEPETDAADETNDKQYEEYDSDKEARELNGEVEFDSDDLKSDDNVTSDTDDDDSEVKAKSKERNTTEGIKHHRISRKNNANYRVVYRMNKNGIKQRFYVLKTQQDPKIQNKRSAK